LDCINKTRGQKVKTGEEWRWRQYFVIQFTNLRDSWKDGSEFETIVYRLHRLYSDVEQVFLDVIAEARLDAESSD